LLQAGFEQREVEAELDRLEAVGLLDDERFAQEFTEHAAASRKQGRRAIAGALAAKGLAPGTISRSLEQIQEGEESRAESLATDRARRLGGLPPETAFRRLFAFLVRRGYDHALARRAATRALELESDGE
jgi:regulatory protein